VLTQQALGSFMTTPASSVPTYIPSASSQLASPVGSYVPPPTAIALAATAPGGQWSSQWTTMPVPTAQSTMHHPTSQIMPGTSLGANSAMIPGMPQNACALSQMPTQEVGQLTAPGAHVGSYVPPVQQGAGDVGLGLGSVPIGAAMGPADVSPASLYQESSPSAPAMSPKEAETADWFSWLFSSSNKDRTKAESSDLPPPQDRSAFPGAMADSPGHLVQDTYQGQKMQHSEQMQQMEDLQRLQQWQQWQQMQQFQQAQMQQVHDAQLNQQMQQMQQTTQAQQMKQIREQQMQQTQAQQMQDPQVMQQLHTQQYEQGQEQQTQQTQALHMQQAQQMPHMQTQQLHQAQVQQMLQTQQVQQMQQSIQMQQMQQMQASPPHSPRFSGCGAPGPDLRGMGPPTSFIGY
jgi:hypothetical protein